MTLPVVPETPAALFEFLMLEYRIRNRTELAKEMKVSPTTLRKIYAGIKPLSATRILHIHEYFGMAVWKIREMSGQHDTAKEKPACRPARNY